MFNASTLLNLWHEFEFFSRIFYSNMFFNSDNFDEIRWCLTDVLSLYLIAIPLKCDGFFCQISALNAYVLYETFVSKTVGFRNAHLNFPWASGPDSRFSAGGTSTNVQIFFNPAPPALNVAWRECGAAVFRRSTSHYVRFAHCARERVFACSHPPHMYSYGVWRYIHAVCASHFI